MLRNSLDFCGCSLRSKFFGLLGSFCLFNFLLLDYFGNFLGFFSNGSLFYFNDLLDIEYFFLVSLSCCNYLGPLCLWGPLRPITFAETSINRCLLLEYGIIFSCNCFSLVLLLFSLLLLDLEDFSLLSLESLDLEFLFLFNCLDVGFWRSLCCNDRLESVVWWVKVDSLTSRGFICGICVKTDFRWLKATSSWVSSSECQIAYVLTGIRWTRFIWACGPRHCWWARVWIWWLVGWCGSWLEIKRLGLHWACWGTCGIGRWSRHSLCPSRINTFFLELFLLILKPLFIYLDVFSCFSLCSCDRTWVAWLHFSSHFCNWFWQILHQG